MPEELTPKDDIIMSRVRQIKYAIDQIGLPYLFCIFMGFLVWYLLVRLDHKMDRQIRNTRAIMQKDGIPVIVGKDEWADDK